jgi:hypothetical protein|tara:strand:+ start:2229 stop:4034 length:1806 start_codon:yes stop_codon:yes gene_type:complete
MAEKLTIYQRLGTLFGGVGGDSNRPDTPTYNFNSQELLRTSNKQEFDTAKLQAQQTNYLTNQWKKVESQLYSQAVYYEPTRLAAYYDYESMEFTPEISAALDIYSEEGTTLSEKGHMLTIYSESNRIKSILADLFNNIMDIQTNLPMWVRNTCKYGDNFVYLKIDPKRGIVGVNQLPNIEVDRVERGMDLNTANKEDDDSAVKFTWKNKDMEFNTWEIAHFRLLSDDRRLPYGTSQLEKCRRIWKQLLLSEDAMLIYRTSRAPERRVFKVYVGNMDDKDVEAYVQRIANNFKRDQIVDNNTGNVDLRYNQMAVDQDYFIPVRDPNAPNPIDTLPGAQNLSEIADIEYIQKKLFAALRIPKAFLGFEDTVGEGKNLALQDIRFARTINRIQKSMIQELNKIAIIHLYVLGFEDELGNFTLGLTNPSTQSELLKIEQWKEKITLYRDATTDAGSGILPVSSTWAKKNILGFSDEEIKLDLQQQRMEKAIGEELNQTATIIKKTGIFTNIDKLYGEEEALSGDETPEDQADDAGGEISLPPTDIGGGDTESPTGDAGDLELSSIGESKLPLILEKLANNNTVMLGRGNKELKEVTEKLDSLLKD